MTSTEPTGPTTCAGREGKYVPWSWGEVFRCTTCGGNVRQSHTVQPLGSAMPGYASVYPIPEHPASSDVT